MKNKFYRPFRNFFLLIIIQLFRLFFFLLPLRAAVALGDLLGAACFYLLKRERNIIYKNLDLVYPGKYDAAAKKTFAKANFRNYGRGMAEFAKINIWPPERTAALITETEGMEYMEKAKAEKKGVAVVTGHFSNWEIMPVFMASRGFKTGVIAKKIFDPSIDAIVNSSRTRAGIKVYDRDKVSKDLIKELKSGMVLGILVDQDTRVESRMVPFLGVPAKTPIGPVAFAKHFGLYLMPVFIIRKQDGTYKFIVKKPLEVNEKDSEEEIALRYNNELSAMIEQYPDQWVWIHERWKNKI